MQFDPQGYAVSGQQPWLDGFCIEKGRIRQFVAAPLGDGITVEEQLSGEAKFGGIQIKAWPLKASVYEALLAERPMFSGFSIDSESMFCESLSTDSMEMGLGMGGSMKQEIYDDRFKPHQWETDRNSRCYVHLLNSATYSQVTGHLPPHQPYEASDYARAGLPWFEYYSDQAALGGSDKFKGLKSWKEFQHAKGDQSVNVEPKNVVHLTDNASDGRPVSQGEVF